MFAEIKQMQANTPNSRTMGDAIRNGYDL